MKKLLILLMAAMFLVACGTTENMQGIELNEDTGMYEFTFDENDFKGVYEKNTGKSIPISFEIGYGYMGIDNATEEQVEAFLKTSYDLLGEDVVKQMHKSFKEDKEELIPEDEAEGMWRKVEEGENLFLDYGILESGKYMSTVNLTVPED